MTMNLSVKNVPDEWVERLRARAKQNHRSLQGEMMAILEEALNVNTISVRELYEAGRATGVRMADESAAMIREDRDAR